jgi:MAF protein
MDRNPLLTLASTSPRRRELITRFELPFELASVDVDESARPAESPQELVQRLGRAKAQDGLRQSSHPGGMVIAADTVVSIDGQILGKPSDPADAVRMLKQLRGRAHIVYSGVVVATRERETTQLAETTVWMRNYTDAEIDSYVATGDPLDKAAAYAIQHPVFHPVAHIDGCYSNVMGLPLCRLYLALMEFGVPIEHPERILATPPEEDCPEARRIKSKISSPKSDH